MQKGPNDGPCLSAPLPLYSHKLNTQKFSPALPGRGGGGGRAPPPLIPPSCCLLECRTGDPGLVDVHWKVTQGRCLLDAGLADATPSSQIFVLEDHHDSLVPVDMNWKIE